MSPSGVDSENPPGQGEPDRQPTNRFERYFLIGSKASHRGNPRLLYVHMPPESPRFAWKWRWRDCVFPWDTGLFSRATRAGRARQCRTFLLVVLRYMYTHTRLLAVRSSGLYLHSNIRRFLWPTYRRNKVPCSFTDLPKVLLLQGTRNFGRRQRPQTGQRCKSLTHARSTHTAALFRRRGWSLCL